MHPLNCFTIQIILCHKYLMVLTDSRNKK
uniref:Uncharacterized protein n=1 Tax=Arundo donax TaxID=35708 RepID=A0A0A8ZPU6_ARUDO